MHWINGGSSRSGLTFTGIDKGVSGIGWIREYGCVLMGEYNGPVLTHEHQSSGYVRPHLKLISSKKGTGSIPLHMPLKKEITGITLTLNSYILPAHFEVASYSHSAQ